MKKNNGEKIETTCTPEETTSPDTASAEKSAQEEMNENTEPAQEEANENTESAQEAEAKMEDVPAQDEYLKLAQRIQADFDNFRRRTRESAAEARLDGIAEAVSQLLPVLDNLSRALAAQEGDGLRTGVEMTARQFVDQLAKLGAEEIPAKGLPFDPAVHNAVMTIPAPEGTEPGSVTEVFLAGYRIGNRIVRHSTVQVSE